MEAKKIALVNGRIFNKEDSFLGQALLLDGERIHGVFPVDAIPADYEKVDVQEANICPGLIDLQIYGAGDDLFSETLSPESIQRIEQNLLQQGCTSFMLTLATNTVKVFKEAIRVFQTFTPATVLGLHLEGPFLNPEKRGAHPEDLILRASPSYIQELLSVDERREVKMMTVAPELIDQQCVDLLLERGIVLSAGHSAASYGEGIAGFEKGITTATHLWNAMSPFHHRNIGLPGAIFQYPTAAASVVVDGIHVDFQAVKISKELMGRRLFLITDAVAASGSGIYKHVFKGDHYTLPDGTLSGSALTMLKAVENCVRHVDIPIDEALRMATSYPAAVIGRTDIGNLDTGSLANVLVFTADFEVKSVFHKGQQVV